MRCKCGNDEFYALQICRHDIIIDSDGSFKEDIGIYDSDKPYGPFRCTECGATYDDLNCAGGQL